MSAKVLSKISILNCSLAVAVLLLGLCTASVVGFFYEEGHTARDVSAEVEKHQLQIELATPPKIEVKSIQASPFQLQLIALIRVGGIEQKVLAGQQLRKNFLVKAIDVNGVDILYQQQSYRYELKSNKVAMTQVDFDARSLQASINLLSHEFHTTSEGLEVYSATQQGLSASLGLQNGDRVSRINGELVRQPEDVLRVLRNYRPEQVLEFVGTRQGQAIAWTFQAQAEN